MIELLRNCSHGNEVMTYMSEDGHFGKRIVKVAYTPQGVETLRCEHAGYEWYQSRLRTDGRRSMSRIHYGASSYARLEIDCFEGAEGDCLEGMRSNYELLMQVIDHYCGIWPCRSGNTLPLHGDFSLGNVIYGADSVRVIDWEHFKPTGSPWGFDALYLLLENMVLSMRGPVPSEDDFDVVADGIRRLASRGKIGMDMQSAPLAGIVEFIKRNHGLWGVYPAKLPVLMLSDEKISFIDQSIVSKLNS